MKIKSILLLIFLVSILCGLCGCTDCVSPNAGISTDEQSINIPVVPFPIDKKTTWVNSGINIKTTEETPLTITGTINFCEAADAQARLNNKKRILVPNLFCQGGTEYGANSACSLSSEGYYIDTDIKVNKGDSLKFNLVKKEIKITDCRSLPEEVSNYNKGDKAPNQRPIDPIEVCENGAEGLGPFLNNIETAVVTNDEGPSSNNVCLNRQKCQWYSSAIIDLRPYILVDEEAQKAFCPAAPLENQASKEEMEKRLKGQDYRALHPEYQYKDHCRSRERDDPLKKFSAYDVNYMCNNFCNGQICENDLYSLRHIYYGEGCYRAELLPKKGGKDGKNEEGISIETHSFADLLVAKIGDQKTDANSVVKQCINASPGKQGGQNCLDINSGSGNIPGIELDVLYKINDDVEDSSSLMLGIAGHPGAYDQGKYSGYNVEIEYSCLYTNGEKLFVYIGNTPENIKPGDPGTYSLHNTEGVKDGNLSRLVLNPQSATNDKTINNVAGTIYFAIQGAEKSSTYKQALKQGDNYIASDNNKYIIEIVKPSWNPNFSAPFDLLITALTNFFYGSTDVKNTKNIQNGGIVKNLFENLRKGLAVPIQATLVLYITTFGLMFLLGMVQSPKADVVIRIIKIAFIILLVSDRSWAFFGQNLVQLFVNSTGELIYYFSDNSNKAYDGHNTFGFLDNTIGIVLTSEFWLRVLSLIFAGPVGWLVFYFLCKGIWEFFSAIFEALINYLIVIVGVSFLLTLAPLFISFILFKKTQDLFNSWLKMLISFSLRPVFLFTFLIFLNQILMAVFYQINSFGACPSCILYLPIFEDEGICLLTSLRPQGFSADDSIYSRMERDYVSGGETFFDLPFGLSAILIFIIVTNMMKHAGNIAQASLDAIFESWGGMSISEATSDAGQALKSIIGKDEQTKAELQQAAGKQHKKRQNVKIEPATGGSGGGIDRLNKPSNNLGSPSDRLEINPPRDKPHAPVASTSPRPEQPDQPEENSTNEDQNEDRTRR